MLKCIFSANFDFDKFVVCDRHAFFQNDFGVFNFMFVGYKPLLD